MREAGIEFLEEEMEQDKTLVKEKKKEERSMRQKYEDDILKLSEPKKKIKVNPNVFEI